MHASMNMHYTWENLGISLWFSFPRCNSRWGTVGRSSMASWGIQCMGLGAVSRRDVHVLVQQRRRRAFREVTRFDLVIFSKLRAARDVSFSYFGVLNRHLTVTILPCRGGNRLFWSTPTVFHDVSYST